MSKYRMPKIEDLLDAGVHFGHQVRRWHPKMEPYIYTVKNKVHIIDLEQTEEMLKKACEFLYETAKNGGQIIFVGTKKQARDIIELEAKRCGAMYITERWLGGTMTNFRIIKKNIDKLVDLMKKREAGELNKYTKKERLMIDREIEKLQKYYGGIIPMRGTPAALFVVDTKREKTAVKEAGNSKVSVVALIDTNSDPTPIKYPIAGNDDAIKSVAIIIKAVAAAVEEGYKEYAVAKEKEEKAIADAKVTAAVTPEVKPEVKVESKVEAKVEAKAEVKTEDKAGAKAEKSPAVKPSKKSEKETKEVKKKTKK